VMSTLFLYLPSSFVPSCNPTTINSAVYIPFKLLDIMGRHHSVYTHTLSCIFNRNQSSFFFRN
jgi:hypothetical protein